MVQDDILRIKLNNQTIGKRKSEAIVGGEQRLLRLVGSGKIRIMNEVPKDVPHAKWQLNMYDVLSCATL